MLTFNPLFCALQLLVDILHFWLIHHIPVLVHFILESIKLSFILILQLVNPAQTLLMLNQFCLFCSQFLPFLLLSLIKLANQKSAIL